MEGRGEWGKRPKNLLEVDRCYCRRLGVEKKPAPTGGYGSHMNMKTAFVAGEEDGGSSKRMIGYLAEVVARRQSLWTDHLSKLALASVNWFRMRKLAKQVATSSTVSSWTACPDFGRTWS